MSSSANFALSMQLWRNEDSWLNSYAFLFVMLLFAVVAFILFFCNRTFPPWDFSRRLDSRVEHWRWGRPHWGQQWRMEIDLSPRRTFPESFPAQRISWERVQVFCLFYFLVYFLFLEPSFYFWSGSMRERAMPRDKCTLYKGVLPPVEWSILFPPTLLTPPKNLKELCHFHETSTLSLSLSFLLARSYNPSKPSRRILQFQEVNEAPTFDLTLF